MSRLLSILGAATLAATAFAVSPKVPISALWNDRTDIASVDLFYGPGGPELAPRHMEFQFVEEDTSGTTPKYIVKDKDGVTWKMKLGVEARPETAASRLIWAAGYYAHPEYFLASAYLKGVPSQLKRGSSRIDPMGGVHHVRLMRMDRHEKIGEWKWRESPFADTREFNGLRVLMAVINNWDLKDNNNAIVRTLDGRTMYCVSDLGASFGGEVHSKGKPERYSETSFVESQKPDTVTFAVPTIPSFVEAIAVPVYVRRVNMRWIAKDIPREHARWMGETLGRLSAEQLRDIFRAAGFAPDEIVTYQSVLANRIATLRAL
jgi:hypothetical protein